jgi:cell wall-associated NlpC family hydrolase
VTILSAAQVAGLVKQAGFPSSDQVIMVAIAKAESGFNTAATHTNSNGSVDRGLFQINSVHGFDPNKLLSDPTFNTQCAKKIYDGQGLRAWTVYTTGAWKNYEAEARQGVAQAASTTGSLPGSDSSTAGTSTPAVTYGGPGPSYTSAGPGVIQEADNPVVGGLGPVRVLGAALEGDVGNSVVGEAKWSAGMSTVPNLALSVVDDNFSLMARGLWAQGLHVHWSDLNLRMDSFTMSGGTAGTGQVDLTCIDDTVFALMRLTGARTASGISATEWIAQELQIAGIDPNRWFLGESVPTQSAISRDVPDQTSTSGGGEKPSAWTTIVRLAKELGKYVFVSGSRLVFGSAAFAMQWCAGGVLQVGWDIPDDGRRWLQIPSVTVSSVASNNNVLQVQGRVANNRAPFFRPGVAVDITATPGVQAAGPYRRLMVLKVEHDLGPDVDGADVTLIQPVDPPPQPPQSNSPNSGSSSANGTSGGSYDSQASQIVALALQQAGKAYVYGAQASPSDPNPRAFDCSELVQWSCARCGIKDCPRTSEQQQAWCSQHGTLISIQEGINTKGALLFQPGHVAISLGNGRTIEAMNEKDGIRQGNANGRGWTAAGRIPGCKY